MYSGSGYKGWSRSCRIGFDTYVRYVHTGVKLELGMGEYIYVFFAGKGLLERYLGRREKKKKKREGLFLFNCIPIGYRDTLLCVTYRKNPPF